MGRFDLPELVAWAEGLGLTQVASMRGGMTAWNRARFPITRVNA